MNKKLIGYALDFVSFLLERINIIKIEKVILFGSVARGEADQKSDIDIFIESKFDIEKQIEKIKNQFYSSTKFENYWKLKNITNDINPIVGEVKKWNELENSIISNGFLLYGKYESMPKNAVHKTLFSWDNIKPESKRVLLFKRLFGYKSDKKTYNGLIDKYASEKISKGSILVPTKNSLVFMKLFKEMKITVRIRKIIEYS